MSGRHEEKERRARERLEREQSAASGEQRRRLVQIVGGVAVACAIVIGVVLAAAGPGSSGSPEAGRPAAFPSLAAAQTAPIPARRRSDLNAAVKAAGCRLLHPPIEGDTHVAGRVKYRSNPPTSGNHSAIWASDGNYVGVRSPAPENYVHSLEHGRIELQYRPGTPKRTIRQLQSVLREPTRTAFGVDGSKGAFALLFANNTKMPYAVAATAWGHLLGCRTASPRMFDAIRAFRTRYTLQAPEKITQAE